MTEDECLLFKVYDSIGGANGQPGGPGQPETADALSSYHYSSAAPPKFVFHTAFDDPSTPPDAPPR